MARKPKPESYKYDDHSYVIEILQKAQDADHDNREMAREAFLFVNKRDGQWEPYWWNQNSGKPRYTFDQVSKIIKQQVNQIKKADFDIRVQPAGGDATKDVAQTYDGIIRNIENMSQVKQIVGRTAKGMVTTGFDAVMADHQYINSDSFDQDLCIKHINNPLDRVWFDPASEKQDKSDSEWVVVLHAVSTEEYADRWPDGSEMSVSDDREGEAYYDKREVIVVGQLLYAKYKKMDLVMMSNGSVYLDDEKFKQIFDDLTAVGITEVKRRTKKIAYWCSRFFDNSAWLDDSKETVFDRCPVIPAYANYDVFENKSIWFGLVEKEMDSQRVLNYSLSREIEEGALAPRAKYWMTEAQATGHEDKLATMNTNSDPVQFYNPDPQAPGAPLQNGGAQINPGLRTISTAMQQMIQETAGQFAASVGDNPNEQSGVAIRGLQNRSDDTNYDYMESMEVMIGALGRVLVGAIPKVYDGQRTVRLLYEDGTFEMAQVNQTVIDNATGAIVTLNDLNQGQYDVICSAGPAFQNRQQETLQAMMSMAQIDPSVMQMGGDVMINSVNTPAAKIIGERKRYQMLQQGMIPPDQWTDEEKEQQAQQAQSKGEQQDPAMVMGMAEMKKAEAEALNAQNNQMKLQIEAAKLQLESKKFETTSVVSTAEAQAAITKSATEQQLTQAKIKTEDAKVALEAEKLRIEQQRLMLDTDIAAAEFRIKEQSEVNRLQQMQVKSQEVQRRARYNRRTGSIEELS